MKKYLLLLLAAAAIFTIGCSDCPMADRKISAKAEPNVSAKGAFIQVSPDEAEKMMKEETDFILLDVRTPGEYSQGHIRQAVNLPNETIQKEPPALLKDKDQRIFVYCRSGRRSNDAATKLAAMGYTNIVEFGGIVDWHGEVVK